MRRNGIGDSAVAILIDLKRTDFEYDVWTLVREFCPEMEVYTNTTDKLDDEDYIRQGSRPFRTQSVYITTEGIKKAKELMEKYGVEDWQVRQS
jgi:hypothetical protein